MLLNTIFKYETKKRIIISCRVISNHMGPMYIETYYNNNNNNNNNNNYLAREFKKLWNMKVTIIPIIINALGTVKKG